MELNEIYQLLEERRRELGLSQAEVDKRAFGKPGNASFQAIRRGASPSYDRLLALGKALNLEFYFGPPRQPISNNQQTGADFARIPRYEAQLAAGAGSNNGDNVPVSSLAFRVDWLSKIGVNPKHCCIVNVAGDSMEPTLYDGDLVMIDQQVRHFRSNRLFAFVNADGDAQVKRVTVHPEALVLNSDNRNYEPQLLSKVDADQLTVIGQVVWSGHNFER